MTPPTLRLARSEEAERILFIEDDAGERFAEVGLTDEFDGLPPDLIAGAVADGLLFVLTDDADVPVAFALCRVFDDSLHLQELNVLRSWQGRGLGRRLLDRVREESGSRQLRRVTLTTFRDVPFNAPFYRRYGFVDLDEGLPDWLRAIRAKEIALGLDVSPRVAMELVTP
ncbi:MAG: GNAT family N-acetyltransferase [Myxococcales bacterium]|nr:GNAT family N-acetyltransferase [Myxococcales bacterium]